ncbi:solute carrier family 35 (UDP-sugar transporter), member A1/2/3 [Sporothrix brasiliensis 5110]|uniref:Solute carrier family 35 (UDP-sugar transporter), member A1/2/3 n=1 Tax=Sporothrix brasiliensis 5110 TaxID=1398154 RepID=A0A0C2IUX2_9PEZI|nr:solute carrier family 35 (UDP-sugar transporter), member A1/2/3 [Sporothrix brasiliensis 5110]KIH88792.1 solute carrier family 35 (UDP-sugar transporter), member A1/2/3 [Sporothrix brasiliensis 5110]
MALLDAAPQTSSGPTLFGLPMKQVSLITLTFQNSLLTLILHYSRVMPGVPGDHRYFASTAVFLNEVLKLAISLTFAIYEVSRTLAPQTPATVLFEQIYNSVFSHDSWKLAIPATLYTLQNTLQYVALGNLDPVHFQILYQLKILTTAFFSVALLGRSLSTKRWIALVVLTMGVSIVSLSSNESSNDTSALIIHDFSDHFFPRSMHELGQMVDGVSEVARELTKRTVAHVASGALLAKRSASYEGINEDQLDGGAVAMNASLGITAVLVAVVVSGLTGVYFEKVLKDSASPVSVWTRNIQLSFYSLFPALFVGIVFKDGADIAQHGFFDGYNWVVWIVIVFQAVGGILTSLCINYADNIAKNFATSISFVISFLFSVVFFGFRMTATFTVGTLLVLASTYLYSGPDRKRGRPPPINIVHYEKTTIDRAGTPVPRIRSADNIRNPSAHASSSHGSAHLDPLDSVRTMGLSTSRPSSPLGHHNRVQSSRSKTRDE